MNRPSDVHRDVLPADAGVFRGARVYERRPSSSPPTRECSKSGDKGVWVARVLPANAGVFRRIRCPRHRPAGSSPPTRGVPTRLGYGDAQGNSSPPTRGCSAVFPDPVPRPGVLLADAEVFRAGRSRTVRWRGPSRRRGGVPVFAQIGRDTGRSSRRRGGVLQPTPSPCSTRRPPCRRRGFRPATGRRNRGIRLPRRSRGVPVGAGWGCSRVNILPAERGVFRCGRRPWGRCRVLSANGGLRSSTMRTRFQTSSLPTRWPRSDRMVPVTLPLFADAKVLRLAGFPRGTGRRRLRRCGGGPL